jgi:hypothetical protein
MAVHSFEDLLAHAGHKVEVATYVDKDGTVVNVAIECMDCYEVLVDYDNLDVVAPLVYLRPPKSSA